jgi:hypothetical protein
MEVERAPRSADSLKGYLTTLFHCVGYIASKKRERWPLMIRRQGFGKKMPLLSRKVKRTTRNLN